MKLKTYTYAFLILGMTLQPSWAEEVEDFITKVQEHYQETRKIKAFSLKYHFLNKQYRDNNYWDFSNPNSVMSQRMVEVDLENKHFYDNDILYSSGGRLFDRAQYQNDKESYFYEKSATTYGKAIINKGMGNFDRFFSWMKMNVDFLAVRPLLAETNIEENITLQSNEDKTITLIHTESDGNHVAYTFHQAPIQLTTIEKKSSGNIYVFSDYQTTRGIQFARSVNSYINGSSEPVYIKYIDQFDIIDKVAPNKLTLPQGYGPELQSGDGVLTSTEIAKNLFLVTDSSAVHNSLLKVNGDNITIFGASTHTSLANKILTLIQEQFPTKKVTAVYVTHPHGHQIAGLNIFAQHGAKILADKYTIAGIKAYTPFADSITTFKFSPIENRQLIDVARFYVLDNLHSKKQSFVYFEDNGVIFQSHFLHIPRDNTIAKVIPSYTKSFIKFLHSEQITFDRIVSNYRNNNITKETLNKTYQIPML